MTGFVNATDERDLTTAMRALGTAMRALDRMEHRRPRPPKTGLDPHYVLHVAADAAREASDRLIDYSEGATDIPHPLDYGDQP